jgi:hypothetical protein
MSVYERDLTSSFAKHAYAKRRIKELDTIVKRYFEDRSHQPMMRADLDPSSGYHVLRIKSLSDFGSFPIDIGVAVGEIIHDLRSALDHAAWQLACEFSHGLPADPRSVYFPVCDPSPGGAHKNPFFLDPCDWAILHEFQPCKGVNGRADGWSGDYIHQLTALHDMWNRDKHVALTVVLMTSNQFSLIPTRSTLPPWIVKKADSVEFLPDRVNDPDPGAEIFDFSHSDKLVELNAEVGRIMVPSWRQCPVIIDAGVVIPRVALEGLRPITSTLERLAEYVHSVVSSASRRVPLP